MLADGAHNPDGVRVLAQSLAAVQVPRPCVGVLAIMRDKDYGAMLRRFLPLLDAVVCTQASEPRSLTAEELAAALRAAARDLGRDAPPVHVVSDPHAALARAKELAGPEGAVLVGGSLYLLEDLSDVVTPAVLSAAPRVRPVGYTLPNSWRVAWHRRRRTRRCGSWWRFSSSSPWRSSPSSSATCWACGSPSCPLPLLSLL